MKRRIVLALCVSVGIGMALMMPEVQVHSSDKEQRFPLLKVEQLNDQQRPFADEILKVSSIGISGPYNMMLRSPVMGQRMFAMLDYLRFNTSVPKRLNEFAILIQARLWTSQVEWTAHYPLALKSGGADFSLNMVNAGPNNSGRAGQQTSFLLFQATPAVFVDHIRNDFAGKGYPSSTVATVFGTVGAHELVHRITGVGDPKAGSGGDPTDLMNADALPPSVVGAAYAQNTFVLTDSTKQQLLDKCQNKHPSSN